MRYFSRTTAMIVSVAILSALTGCSSGSGAVGRTDSAFRQLRTSQFDLPGDEDQVAIFTTDIGEIKIRLFHNDAPNAVENFIGLANSGYYDGQSVYRVLGGFMIMSGDEKDRNKSFWGTPISVETPSELHHFRGALSMYSDSETGGNGSEFFIIQGGTVDEDLVNEMEEAGTDEFSSDCIADYQDIGGYPQLDGDYTVFGQVYEGIGIVDVIAAVVVEENPAFDDELSLPAADIIIRSVEIMDYADSLKR